LITRTASQFGTNVVFADEEHHILFGKLNKLYDLASGGAGRSAIREQLDDLRSISLMKKKKYRQKITMVMNVTRQNKKN